MHLLASFVRERTRPAERAAAAPARFRRRSRPPRAAAALRHLPASRRPPRGARRLRARAGHPRTHIAGCAENRPECVSRQENDRRCAEKRPECVPRQRPAGARRARTGRQPLHAFWETAGQAGDIIFSARKAARGGSGRRRRGAEVGLPDNTLCPIFSTTTPFRLPENALWSIFSTCSAGGTGLKGRLSLGAVRPLRPRPRRASGAGRPVRASGLQVRRLRTRLRRAAEGSCRMRPAFAARSWSKLAFTGGWNHGKHASVVKNGSRWRQTPADRPRFSGGGTSAPVAPAAKPQFRRPYQEAWSKPAFSVPTAKAGFDHGAPACAGGPAGGALGGGAPCARPERARGLERTSDPRPAARNLHQSPQVGGRPQAHRAHRRGEAPTRHLGDLWRFRKAKPQVDEPWAAGSMNIDVHRPLSAALPAGWNHFQAEPTHPGRAARIPTGEDPPPPQAFATSEILRLQALCALRSG